MPALASSARPLARGSVALSSLATAASLLGWIAFGFAIALGDHFNTADPASAWLLLLWMVLGVVAFGAWSIACALAGLASSRARRNNEQGVANPAIVMAIVAPASWILEWALLVLWFGFEALSGPWIM